MHSSQRIIVAAAAVVAMLLPAAPAMAHMHDYSGAWPVTITNSQRSNGTGCLTLKGSSSGSASLTFGSQRFPYGSFIVVDNILMATITEPLYGQNGAITFVAPAKRSLGHGLFENIEGGSNFDFGDLAFGAKGGC